MGRVQEPSDLNGPAALGDHELRVGGADGFVYFIWGRMGRGNIFHIKSFYWGLAGGAINLNMYF